MNTLTKPDPNRPYWREEIDKEFEQVKKRMHREALKRGRAYDGESIALYHDCYTCKMLRGGDKYDYDHIRSSKEILMQYLVHYNHKQIAKIVNCPKTSPSPSAASTSPKASAGWKTGWPSPVMWRLMEWTGSW